MSALQWGSSIWNMYIWTHYLKIVQQCLTFALILSSGGKVPCQGAAVLCSVYEQIIPALFIRRAGSRSHTLNSQWLPASLSAKLLWSSPSHIPANGADQLLHRLSSLETTEMESPSRQNKRQYSVKGLVCLKVPGCFLHITTFFPGKYFLIKILQFPVSQRGDFKHHIRTIRCYFRAHKTIWVVHMFRPSPVITSASAISIAMWKVTL